MKTYTYVQRPQWFQSNLKTVARLIRQSNRIILACHRNPDGDAIGSMLALGRGLSKIRKSVVMLCPDAVPVRYMGLMGVGEIKQYYREEADLAISVDCGSLTQLSNLEEAFARSKKIIEIDHHLYRTRFGDIQLIDRTACSVGEIVFLLLEELKIPIDKYIAECLLISTLVETSSFSREEIKISTLKICAELLKTGVDFRKVSDRYYWQKRFATIHLSGLCLLRAKLRAKDRLVWSIIYQKDFKKYNGTQDDVDSIPDELMQIENIQVAILFREIEDNMLRVSIRSKENVDIGYLASIYGGGGHHNVAGCRIHNTTKTFERFINQACGLIYKKKRYYL